MAKNITFHKAAAIFREKEKKIVSKKNVLSKEDFQKEIKSFSEGVKKYNEEKKNKINQTTKENNEKIVKLLKKINSILVEYSKENNISTIIDKNM